VQILINGRMEQVPAGTTVAQLLHTKKITAAAAVVAINDEVVERETWSDRAVSEGDQVEVIRIVGGG